MDKRLRINIWLGQYGPALFTRPAVKVGGLNFVAGLVLSACVGATGSALAQGLELKESALQQIKILQQEKASRTPAQRKMSSKLVRALKATRGDPMMAQLPGLRSSVRYEADGQVKVDISTNVDNHAALEARINVLGGTVINSHPRFNRVRATLPLDSMELLAASEAVRSIRQADRMYLNEITSEGDTTHTADWARSGFTVDGNGQKVCVLSDSVDQRADLISSGELPPIGILKNNFGVPQTGEPGSSRGTAMMEIMHDLAPGANLYFATSKGGEAQFAQNIIGLYTEFDCTIMVDDAGYFYEAVFQDGIVASAVNQVTAAGVLYFSAAGNAGNLKNDTSGVWEGNFVGIPGPPNDEFDGPVQDFGGGIYANTIKKDPPWRISLQWSDPLAASSNDYDFYLMDPDLTTIIEAGKEVQDGDDDPYEWIDSEDYDDTGNVVLIVKDDSKGPVEDRFIHLNTHRGTLDIPTGGQIFGHAAAADAFSVAAVDWFKGSLTPIPFDGTESVETFSSDGPRRVFYYEDGTPVTPGNFLAGGGMVRQKPDITAANRVSTATTGYNPFVGTSASAPHAAAIAALMLEFDSTMDTELARTVFNYSSLDIEAPGIDPNSGMGIVMAFDALDAIDKMQENTSCTSAPALIDTIYDCKNAGAIAVGPGVEITNTGLLRLDGTAIGFTGEVSIALGGSLEVIAP